MPYNIIKVAECHGPWWKEKRNMWVRFNSFAVLIKDEYSSTWQSIIYTDSILAL